MEIACIKRFLCFCTDGTLYSFALKAEGNETVFLQNLEMQFPCLYILSASREDSSL